MWDDVDLSSSQSHDLDNVQNRSIGYVLDEWYVLSSSPHLYSGISNSSSIVTLVDQFTSYFFSETCAGQVKNM